MTESISKFGLKNIYNTLGLCYFFSPYTLHVVPLLHPFITQSGPRGPLSLAITQAPHLHHLVCQVIAQLGSLQQLKKVVTGRPFPLRCGASCHTCIQAGHIPLRACSWLPWPWPVPSHWPHRCISAFQRHHRPGEVAGGVSWQDLSARIRRFFFRDSLHLQHVRHRHTEASVQRADLAHHHLAGSLLRLPRA